MAISAIGVVGVTLIGGMHLYGEKAMAVYRDAADNARSIAELNRGIEVGLLEGRRAEKDFLLRSEMKKAESQVEIAKAVAADVETLRGRLAAVGKPDLARQIEAMNASLKKYQGHFAAVVEQRRQLSLDEKSGLEGRPASFGSRNRISRRPDAGSGAPDHHARRCAATRRISCCGVTTNMATT